MPLTVDDLVQLLQFAAGKAGRPAAGSLKFWREGCLRQPYRRHPANNEEMEDLLEQCRGSLYDGFGAALRLAGNRGMDNFFGAIPVQCLASDYPVLQSALLPRPLAGVAASMPRRSMWFLRCW